MEYRKDSNKIIGNEEFIHKMKVDLIFFLDRMHKLTNDIEI